MKNLLSPHLFSPYLMLLLVCTLLPACQSENKPDNMPQQTSSSVANSQTAPSKVQQSASEDYLVKVNNSPITETQLQQAMQRLLGQQRLLINDTAVMQQTRQQVLDSLILAKSMALLAEQTMDSEALQQLQADTQAYREELLVKHYLSQNLAPQSITEAMIKSYYQEHPEEFGAGSIKHYEQLTFNIDHNFADLKKQAQTLAPQQDWQQQALALTQQGQSVTYSQAQSRPELAISPIAHLLKSTQIGQASALIKYQHKAYMLRITQETPIAAKPLALVSQSIRKKLQWVLKKKALQAVKQTVLQNVQLKHNPQAQQAL